MPFKYPPIEERFWAKVDKSGECWLWTGTTSLGYGRIQRDGKSISTHRLSYELEYGEIPEGMEVCHNCPNNQDNPRCVRPAHLWLGTHADNMRDMKEKGRSRNHRRGETSYLSKLKDEDVIEIRKLASQGVPQKILASKFGVASSAISYIINRINWKHIA